jgi:hypothetical protein
VPPLLTLAAAVAFTSWLFLILPRLQGHPDPWEHEYDAAYRAYQRDDFATAEQHLRAAYALAQEFAEGRKTIAAGLADVLEKSGRQAEAEQYRIEAAQRTKPS